MSQKYWVSMTDTFLSGWGRAKNKINILLIECRDFIEAGIVEQNANDRTDMKNILVHISKPFFPAKHYFVSYKTLNDYERWRSPDRPFLNQGEKNG